MTVTEINPLPIPEQIIRMEEMWDSLRQEPQLIAPPEWHHEILNSRIERLKSNQAKTITLQELKARK
ncbi:addiction module protein [Methylomonas rivi]|uniref:Addiction module protein n=1 Tax=Methylomonas rivi TaxID=2952226 RepID=A0ABT1U9G2_9GAMM|nr:addiction module protein [Methylomonas sp. WSC-6]MCQ8130437.1 addiction module protein [Methylomonas sp. WSC-6]